MGWFQGKESEIGEMVGSSWSQENQRHWRGWADSACDGAGTGNRERIGESIQTGRETAGTETKTRLPLPYWASEMHHGPTGLPCWRCPSSHSNAASRVVRRPTCLI